MLAMASFQKTFRKSGNHHAEFHSLVGVEVKIGEKFRPPKKVTLPVGWQQKDPSAALSLTYDFSLEKDVISKADALRASKQEQLEISLAESQVASSSAETLPNQNSVFSNVGSEILQPVVAPGTGHKKNDSFGGKGKNAIDLADFEGDTSTPFELVELQTINDLDELKNVLQLNTVSATAAESSSSLYDNKAHTL
ncbi:Ubiquitin-associated protein 1 [Desmophyllum pertusum]|uniref:Ubiquitin-associated protein 1 n=1 Tax=Desmophyllum pertusum TaxID=174260 RepID=A0A9X0CMV2_9CNID|nr:Ubiquitin-associated protein 1 [Desmophyllum pertusum]